MSSLARAIHKAKLRRLLIVQEFLCPGFRPCRLKERIRVEEKSRIALVEPRSIHDNRRIIAALTILIVSRNADKGRVLIEKKVMAVDIDLLSDLDESLFAARIRDVVEATSRRLGLVKRELSANIIAHLRSRYDSQSALVLKLLEGRIDSIELPRDVEARRKKVLEIAASSISHRT